MRGMPSVAALYVYPLKGAAGISLDASVVEPWGLRGDRRWMLVDETGGFISQRNFPLLCRIAVEQGDKEITFGFGEDSLTLPIATNGPRTTVRVWQDDVQAQAVSAEADAWFSERLGRPCRLVHIPPDAFRQTHLEYTRPGDRVGFADAFPVLVASEASLADLNARLEHPLPMNRFRPNLVIGGCLPYEEDEWPAFTLGGVRFRAAKKCGRCSVTTTDQETGEVGVEPLRTLATYRREGKTVAFGAYFVPENEGILRVGEPLEMEKAPGRTGP